MTKFKKGDKVKAPDYGGICRCDECLKIRGRVGTVIQVKKIYKIICVQVDFNSLLIWIHPKRLKLVDPEQLQFSFMEE